MKKYLYNPSFVEAIEVLPDEVQLEIYRAIGRYDCYGILPDDLSPVAQAMFMMAKSKIEEAEAAVEAAEQLARSSKACNNPYGRRGKNSRTNRQETTAAIDDDTTLFDGMTDGMTDDRRAEIEKELNSELILIENKSNLIEPIENQANGEIKKNQKELKLIKQEFNLNRKELNLNQKEIEKENEKEETKKEESSPHTPYKEEINKEEKEKDRDKEKASLSQFARAREEFLKDFFDSSRIAGIEKQRENIGVTDARYAELINEVLDDWEINGPVPAPDNETRLRMLYTVRKKHQAQQAKPGKRPVRIAPAVPAESYNERLAREQQRRKEIFERPDNLSGEALARKLAGFNLDAPTERDAIIAARAI